jgi:hypothetical protein
MGFNLAFKGLKYSVFIFVEKNIKNATSGG